MSSIVVFFADTLPKIAVLTPAGGRARRLNGSPSASKQPPVWGGCFNRLKTEFIFSEILQLAVF